MIKDITIGQYFPGESVLHHLDPRTKLLLTVFLFCGACVWDLPFYAWIFWEWAYFRLWAEEKMPLSLPS